MNSAKGKRRLVLDFIDEEDGEKIIYTADSVSMRDIANGVSRVIKDLIEMKYTHDSIKFIVKMFFVYNVASALGLDYITGLIKQGFEDAGVDIRKIERFSATRAESVH